MIEYVLPPKNNPATRDRIVIHFDGLTFETPPHPSAWSFIVRLNGEKVFEDSGPVPALPEYTGDEAIAKFLGLHEALRWLSGQSRVGDHDHIVVNGDNLLVIGSMQGNRPPPDNKSRQPWVLCRALASQFFKIQFVWITKPENRECRVLTLGQIEKMRIVV